MISVIIDNYNYGRYLAEAIESVIGQNYKDWELIVVDDGSEDDSVSIINSFVNRYPDKIRKVIKENGGQASCFNCGFEESNGDIIAFLDSDDKWFPDKLAKIKEAHDLSSFVAHEKLFSNGKDQKISTEKNEKRSYYLKKYGLFPTYDITTSTMSFSRSLLEKIMPVPEKEFRICADHYLTFSATYFENVCYLHEKLSFYRIHDKNGFVTMTQESKNEFAMQQLDFACVEYLNKRLLQMDEKLPEVPHRCHRLTDMLLKDAGEGFEIRPGGKYVVYGTSYVAGSMINVIIQREGIIYAFCDGNQEKQNTVFYTKEVWSPRMLIERRGEYDRIIIASFVYADEIKKVLHDIGLRAGDDYIYTPVL